MALLPDAPCVILLEAAKTALVTANWLDLTGINNVTARHYRGRRSNSVDERPGISIMFVSDGPPDEDTAQISHYEKLHQLDITLMAEAEIPPEDPEAGLPADPTGLRVLNLMLAGAMAALRDPALGFYSRVHEISDGLKELDEASQADIGRLMRQVSVLYRVRSDDENILLS